MTDGYQAARGERNALERLVDKIPGFRGFQDRELRRDVDRLQREHLASELGRLKNALRERARAFADRGQIGMLAGFDRLDRRLDGLGQSVRFSDYGASGFFDPVKVGEDALARLYEFDLALLDELADLEREIGALPAPGGEAVEPALERLEERVRGLGERWGRREQVISDVVKTAR